MNQANLQIHELCFPFKVNLKINFFLKLEYYYKLNIKKFIKKKLN